MSVAIIPERLAKIERLSPGGHDPSSGEMCIMEAVAFVTGEPWSDHPACVDTTLAALLRSLNDGPFSAHLGQLTPYITQVVGTAGASDSVQRRRGYLLTDWAVRAMAATAMDAADLPDQAAMLRALAPVVDDATQETARSAAAEAAEAAEAAWAAEAARAARAARAAEAARAAWAAEAAEAAWAAQRQDEIRASSLALLDRLLAVTDETATDSAS